VLGLVAVVLINSYIGSTKKVQQAQVQTGVGQPVVVAAAVIQRGTPLTPANLKVVNYPSGAVPQGTHPTVQELTSADKTQQRLAMRDLVADEPIFDGLVTKPGQNLNLSTELDPGMQAVTLRTSDIQGVAGFVFPNDRVDLLLSRSVGQGDRSIGLTQVIAENVKVVAIDQSDDTGQNKPTVVKAITFEVTPEQAQSLTLAQTLGTVSLSLRHVQDTAPVNRLVTTAASFGFFAAPPTAAHRKGPTGPTVRVTRGADTSVVELSSR
jgi:pilus assembly protein CpaB